MYNKKRAKCKDFTYFCEVSYKIDELEVYLCRQFPDLSPYEVGQLCIVICNQYAETGLLSFESVTRVGERVIVRPYKIKYLHKDADTICLWWRSYCSHLETCHES